MVSNVNSLMEDGTIYVCNNLVEIDGVKLPPAPCKGNHCTISNGNVYIDGYEFKRCKWRRTFMALWHLLF